MSWSPEKKREMRAFYRREVLNAYGHACVCCGVEWESLLCLDHVDGRAGNWRERDRDIYEKVYRSDFPDSFQLLCYNCNNMKFRHGDCECRSHLRIKNREEYA